MKLREKWRSKRLTTGERLLDSTGGLRFNNKSSSVSHPARTLNDGLKVTAGLTLTFNTEILKNQLRWKIELPAYSYQ